MPSINPVPVVDTKPKTTWKVWLTSKLESWFLRQATKWAAYAGAYMAGKAQVAGVAPSNSSILGTSVAALVLALLEGAWSYFTHKAVTPAASPEIENATVE